MKTFIIIVTLVAIVALGEAYIDEAVYHKFMNEAETGKQQVIDGRASLIDDIKLHPDNHFQHKTYCGQLITMINNVITKIDQFSMAYHNVIGSGQSSAVSYKRVQCNELLTDLNELNKTI